MQKLNNENKVAEIVIQPVPFCSLQTNVGLWKKSAIGRI